MSDFNSLTASELGDLIGKGEIDPVELTEYFISQIELSLIGKNLQHCYFSVGFRTGKRLKESSQIRSQAFFIRWCAYQLEGPI